MIIFSVNSPLALALSACTRPFFRFHSRGIKREFAHLKRWIKLDKTG
jgi:hypothetical protein